MARERLLDEWLLEFLTKVSTIDISAITLLLYVTNSHILSLMGAKRKHLSLYLHIYLRFMDDFREAT